MLQFPLQRGLSKARIWRRGKKVHGHKGREGPDPTLGSVLAARAHVTRERGEGGTEPMPVNWHESNKSQLLG